MDEPKKLKSPILGIWRRLQSGEMQLKKRIKRKIGDAFSSKEKSSSDEKTTDR
jgi:hypothetical protein